MNLWRRFYTSIFGRPSPEERMVLKIQIVLLLAISLLLNIGFDTLREWRRVAEQNQLHTSMLGWDGFAWYTWLAAAPAMLLIIRRFPLTRERLWHNLAYLLAFSVVICVAVANLRYLLRLFPNIWLPDREDLPTGWLNYIYNTYRLWPLDFLTYCGFFAVSFSLDYFFKYRLRTEEAVQLQLKAVQLQSDLARAELSALRGQLHPHFLFNSFNAVATLVRQKKNESAVEIIAQLSALLRLAIDRSGLQEIPLENELDFIRRYLEIEHVRFGDKLRIEWAVAPETLNALVPNIVLQPLVENAIKHGISLRTDPGTVRIASAQVGERLQIEIFDDGPDDPRSAAAARAVNPRRTGIGLTNTRAQLDKLYGTDYRLEMIKRAEGGTIVKLDLPWREALVPQISL